MVPNIIEALQSTIPKAIDGFNTAVPAAFNEMQAGLPDIAAKMQAELPGFATEFGQAFGELQGILGGDLSDLSSMLPGELSDLVQNGKIFEQLQNLNAMVPDLFKGLNHETVAALGRLAIPPQISAIDLEQLPILAAMALKIATENWTTKPTSLKIAEPGVPVGGNATSTVWNSRYNGSYIEMHAGGSNNDEFINIQHASGTRITLDQKGTLTIKAADGKLFIGSTGDIETSAEGHSMNAAQDGYTLEVTGGAINIKSAGDINFTTNGSINMNAATDIKMNCGANMDVSAKGRMAFMAESDNIDIMAGANLKLGASRGNISVIAGKSVNTEAGSQINHNAAGPIVTYAGGYLGLRGSTVYVKGGGNIHLNDGDVNEPKAADPVYPAQIGVEPPKAKVVSPADPTGEGQTTGDSDGGRSDGPVDETEALKDIAGAGAGATESTAFLGDDVDNRALVEQQNADAVGVAATATPAEGVGTETSTGAVTDIGPAIEPYTAPSAADAAANASKLGAAPTVPAGAHLGDGAIAAAAGYDSYAQVPDSTPDTPIGYNPAAVAVSSGGDRTDTAGSPFAGVLPEGPTD